MMVAIFTVSRTGLYKLTEVEPLEGYLGINPIDVSLDYKENGTQTFKVENRLKPIDITVKKIWENEKGETIQSPRNVTFELFSNGSMVRRAVLQKGEEELIFTNLPIVDKNGNKIKYEVQEVPIEGFETSVEEKSNTLSVVTNKIKTKDLKVTKDWLDAQGNPISALEKVVIVLEKTVDGKTTKVDEKNSTSIRQALCFKTYQNSIMQA